MAINNFNIHGLSEQEVLAARSKYGANSLSFKKENGFVNALIGLTKEPMVILLLVTSCIYFISGKAGDGIFLASAIVLVSGISLYQDSRSRNALEKLKDFSQPKCKVIRHGEVLEVKKEELVIGDSLIVEEGTFITADGVIEHSNDFSINESILTGESLAVFKDKSSADNLIFSGTTVASGLAIATVTAIGNQTRLGKIGRSLESIAEEKTPLEIQISNFVKKMVIVGVIVFLTVWGINYFHSANILDSLLKALTLAMSILPEEIPVAFTTFMALGAWRLMKIGVVVKQMKTVETLGSASVICTDKTGTLTENKMSLAKAYVLKEDCIYNLNEKLSTGAATELIALAMWASEPIPFDPMEVALHNAYTHTNLTDERSDYKMIHEYPLGGKPPMMTHLFENGKGNRIIAAKGAPEALIGVSNLNQIEKEHVTAAIAALAIEGYRVLAVGEANFVGSDFPATQQEFHFVFKGLVAFYDPPKKNITAVLQGFYKAGIKVKIITGDNTETSGAIAKQIDFHGADQCISGDMLMQLSEQELREKVKKANIFTRMFPDAKLKIINALKAQNEIVAMTGDGVNDGSALKAAHIGIAMGKKGTEIAKQAASLILLEDDLSKMVDAVAMGRRIYTNLKKAIQYIISIHIPIVLTVFIPLALGWIYPNIFSPVHIIFLELIMGPTCSIIYENEPIEKNAMLQKPRPFSTTFFNWKELATSIVQGAAITIGTLTVYQYAVSKAADEQVTRTMVFTTLISANVLLTLVNRSFYYSLFTTIKYKNNLVLLVIGLTIFISSSLIYIRPLAVFFGFNSLNISDLVMSTIIGFTSVIWFELYKAWLRKDSEVKTS
ncbi:cation-translocating P-type ATPase [Mucilaginibacter rubeus]|uniref:Cation-translocating P-type ATPase n=1 Tax=Mucilaginibacter rubeus TaxID=2027860 RepID=A0AAE6JE03_9SPHI|nr:MULTISPECIES: cation-translocating P-type ATPase [Mucilaginibacter]QEM03563.1 cation-translocating P-type ATPase [Mucilaginibacter rubeus]QEM16174.1 cation-translocating P-type ATPase [Mucilaginibacter gossypii]QTE41067.1 cation-translocating P-type ATPase [Mucilaginibacter rubeus]QTE47670.1 cation-translocating P-type ATPase [Mucilaginibacter rubeus]QTE59062.1 cation-translocating P-type ATPase [Mucilaginibacter rubeus]